jgi:hypothetical protein
MPAAMVWGINYAKSMLGEHAGEGQKAPGK